MTTPYQEFLAERQEIDRYKWLVSERDGKDIGFERALTDWVSNHREAWRQTRPQCGSASKRSIS